MHHSRSLPINIDFCTGFSVFDRLLSSGLARPCSNNSVKYALSKSMLALYICGSISLWSSSRKRTTGRISEQTFITITMKMDSSGLNLKVNITFSYFKRNFDKILLLPHPCLHLFIISYFSIEYDFCQHVFVFLNTDNYQYLLLQGPIY